jgi:arginyl-tRNA synthetase
MTAKMNCSAHSPNFQELWLAQLNCVNRIRVARYLEELAGVYHGFYADCRVLPMGDEPDYMRFTARELIYVRQLCKY